MELEDNRWLEFYVGSRIFQPFSNWSGIPIDQINFLIGELLALSFAYFFRIYLHPEKTCKQTRHVSALTAGVAISYFCFGKQLLLAIGFILVCYLLLLLVPASICHHVTMCTALTFLSAIHMQRQFYEDGLYVIDITGPLMVMVQKVTSLAYSFNDAKFKEDKDLTTLQKKQLLKNKPTMLEYFSYLLSFQSVLAGPYCMFTDYQEFIEGTHYIKWDMHRMKVERLAKCGGLVASNNNYKSANNENRVLPREYDPNPIPAVNKKLIIVFLCAISVVFVRPRFPVKWFSDPAFFSSSLFVKLGYIFLVPALTRQLYYTGWFLGEAVCLMSGMGFNGYSEDGDEKWDLVDTVDILGVELATNFKGVIDSWNKTTALWLRFMVYERVPFQPLIVTYFLSSMWHGFYPGYYLTFFGGAYFTVVARIMRRHIRPFIVPLGKSAMKLYDYVTIFTNWLCLSYITFPFVLLRFWQCIDVYISVGFYFHILGMLAYLLLPRFLPIPKKSRRIV